jgi:hypothetical protein
MRKPVIWSVSELADMTKDRIKNHFDSNIAITGVTGIGKSTFLHKFFHKFKDFKIKDKFTTKRERMVELIKSFTFSYCWNDELISAGNKRKFYDTEQIELISIMTKYRDNFNIVGGAVPFFFTLDKELIKLFGMHINIIERGIGVVHLPRPARLYTEDQWDISVNSKLEEEWSKNTLKNPSFKIPYWKYTTFAGFVYFGKMTDKQEEEYKYLKKNERDETSNGNENVEEVNFYSKVLSMLKERKLNEDELLKVCLVSNRKLSSVKARLGQMLRDEGDGKTLGDFLRVENKNNNNTNNIYNNTNGMSVDIDL